MKKNFSHLILVLILLNTIVQSANNSYAIGGNLDHPHQEGQVITYRKLEKIPNKANTYKMTLTVQAKDYQKSNDVVLVIDCSSSMYRKITKNDELIVYARETAKKFVKKEFKINDKARIAIVPFGSIEPTSYSNIIYYTKNEEDKLLSKIDSDTKEKLGKYVMNVGLNQANKYFNNFNNNNTVILLTNGYPNYGKKVDKDKLVKYLEEKGTSLDKLYTTDLVEPINESDIDKIIKDKIINSGFKGDIKQFEYNNKDSWYPFNGKAYRFIKDMPEEVYTKNKHGKNEYEYIDMYKMKKKSNNTVIPSYCHAFNDGGNNNKYYYYLPYAIESEAETLKQRGIKLYIIAFGIEEPSSEYMKSFASKDENGNPLFYNLNPIIKVEKAYEYILNQANKINQDLYYSPVKYPSIIEKINKNLHIDETSIKVNFGSYSFDKSSNTISWESPDFNESLLNEKYIKYFEISYEFSYDPSNYNLATGSPAPARGYFNYIDTGSNLEKNIEFPKNTIDIEIIKAVDIKVTGIWDNLANTTTATTFPIMQIQLQRKAKNSEKIEDVGKINKLQFAKGTTQASLFIGKFPLYSHDNIEHEYLVKQIGENDNILIKDNYKYKVKYLSKITGKNQEFIIVNKLQSAKSSNQVEEQPSKTTSNYSEDNYQYSVSADLSNEEPPTIKSIQILPQENNKPSSTKQAVSKSYIFGYTGDKFMPEKPITRAEVAVIIGKLLNLDFEQASEDFYIKDVEKESWYEIPVKAVVKAGYMSGYPDGKFNPKANITRAEFLQIIKNMDIKNESSSPFIDIDKHWAKSAINQAYANGRITYITGNKFNPNSPINRAEAISTINSLKSKKTDKSSFEKLTNKEKLVKFSDVNENHWAYYDILSASNAYRYEIDPKTKVEKWLEVLN